MLSLAGRATNPSPPAYAVHLPSTSGKTRGTTVVAAVSTPNVKEHFHNFHCREVNLSASEEEHTLRMGECRSTSALTNYRISNTSRLPIKDGYRATCKMWVKMSIS